MLESRRARLQCVLRRPGLHCDLIYTGLRESLTGAVSAHRMSEERWRAEITETYRRQRRVTVEHIERASEAPPIGDQPLEVLLQAAGGPVDSDRWLVWWR